MALNVTRADGGSLNELPTRGGTVIVITGERFGSSDSPRPVDISGLYAARDVASAYRASCFVSVEFTETRCTTTEGIGMFLHWKLRIEGNTVDIGEFTHYAPPTVHRVEVQSGRGHGSLEGHGERRTAVHADLRPREETRYLA